MTSTKAVIPLSQQPAYQAAVEKIVEIGRALAATKAKLETCHAELLESQHRGSAPHGVIERALALAGGSSYSAMPAAVTTTTEITRRQEERNALEAGLNEANKAANAVAQELSAAIGAQARPQHVAAVAHLLACLEALCKATRAEEDIRGNLERLGYSRHGLPFKGMTQPGRIEDTSGSAAFYFAREARAYINQYSQK